MTWLELFSENLSQSHLIVKVEAGVRGHSPLDIQGKGPEPVNRVGQWDVDSKERCKRQRKEHTRKI